MIQTSQAYREAIVGSPRRIELTAVVDISDPDKIYLPVTSSGEAPWSKSEQLHDMDLTSPLRMMTMEDHRVLLDGSFDVFPDGYGVPGEVGFAGDRLCGLDGSFSPPFVVQRNFDRVRILQAFSLFFSTDPADGIPRDFTVEVVQGGTAYYTQEVTGNRKTELRFDSFTVYDPEAVRLTVTRWSLPHRRVRITEIVLGYFEKWDPEMFASFSADLRGDFSCLSLPRGSVRMAIDNQDRKFEPRRKDSVFQSIEERQGIDFFLGCLTTQGMERLKLGLFYQAGDGWKTSTNAPTMEWYLVDLIGLIADRTFLPPDPLPTTLAGWLRALVSQLGDSFVNRWRADPAYESLPVTANSREEVTGKKCGDILRWVCQATGTWPRARQQDGALTAEPLWNQGNKITLDNLEEYPTLRANKSLAALIFHLADGNSTEYVVSGNSTSSEETITINNPFLHTREQALAAAKLILAQYGGNQVELVGRGDPSSEIGDVDTVWLDESNAAAARRMAQSFQFRDGVLRGCRSTLLQADGSYLWTEFTVITESGQWRAPPGVRQLRVVIGQAGQGGGPGGDGFVTPSGNLAGGGVAAGYGDPGVNGQGGRIWYGVIDCNEEQVFQVLLGAGGAAGTVPGEPGAPGGHTTFGPYSSENGKIYENGYTDIANGQTFARTGVEAPLPGTGDGGKGGDGGEPGAGYWKQAFWPDGRPQGWDWIVTKPPGKGKPGVPGGAGFVMVSWEK